MAKLFDFQMVFTIMPQLAKALPMTLRLALSSMFFGLLLGLIIAIVKMNRVPVLSPIATFFVSLVRGTPVVVQLYIAYFGIPMCMKAMNLNFGTSFNINKISGLVCAIAALSINESAYCSETIRAALLSVDQGQIEAANSLGMTYLQALRRIILPEAIEVALPGLGNAFISLIKGTSLAFTCAVVEITAQGKIIGGRTYRYFEVYVALAIIYWIITIVIEQILKVIERKIRIPDQVPIVAQETEKTNG